MESYIVSANQNEMRMSRKYNRIIKLAGGVIILLAIFTLLSQTPPLLGDNGTIQHNLDNEIDATPLFYAEVEGIFDMGREVEAEVLRVSNLRSKE